VRVRRDPWRFAKALPSEDGREASGRGKAETHVRVGEGPSAIHGVTQPGAWPLRGHSLPRGSNKD
jgi:hypothetical protein